MNPLAGPLPQLTGGDGSLMAKYGEETDSWPADTHDLQAADAGWFAKVKGLGGVS